MAGAHLGVDDRSKRLLVGAGLIRSIINPPIALYYMQGLNTTANSDHAALFGVYEMLGLALALYCMRGQTNIAHRNPKLLTVPVWSLNIGLAMMTFLSLLPQACCKPNRSLIRSIMLRAPVVVTSCRSSARLRVARETY